MTVACGTSQPSAGPVASVPTRSGATAVATSAAANQPLSTDAVAWPIQEVESLLLLARLESKHSVLLHRVQLGVCADVQPRLCRRPENPGGDQNTR